MEYNIFKSCSLQRKKFLLILCSIDYHIKPFSNIIKYSKNVDCSQNLTNSKTLRSLWKNSFMDNEMKTFCFKLHNNTVGYNYTVNKFTRNHNPYCTFCTLSREPEDEKETPYHLFFVCRHTEQIYEIFFRRLLQQLRRRTRH